MGRPPCCDKVGIKKGPWTPEEDIILVSYIQEHGPGNWRSVPTNTGLLRCSKSCRLRWTNYLRPGIKRGNFTPHEEGMIIHLQALLGNKWAAIASYLPQRTDNDIKNYWNTHLKKKLKKFQSALEPAQESSTSNFVSKNFNERSRNSLDLSPNASSALKLYQTSSTSTNTTNTNTNATNAPYASSAENISRLLEGWMRTSPKPNNSMTTSMSSVHDHFYRPKVDQENVNGGVNVTAGGDMISHEEFESILSFENMNNVAWEHKSTCDSIADASDDHQENENNINNKKGNKSHDQNGNGNNNNPPLSFLEKWLLDESGAAGHVEEDESMQLSPIF